MNRKGFLKRIAGAVGLAVVGKEVVAEHDPFPGRHYRGIKLTRNQAQRMMNHRVSELAEKCANGTIRETMTIRRPFKYEASE